VVSSQALKLHGGTPETSIQAPDREGLRRGLANLQRHIENMQSFGQPVVVAFNTFPFDLEEEIELVRMWCNERGAKFSENRGYLEGGKGSAALAKTVLDLVEESFPSKPIYHYALTDSIPTKIETIVKKLYRGSGIKLSKKAAQNARKMEAHGWGELPVCIAKTQYSFSGDAGALGVSEGFVLEIEDLLLNAGAGFVVAVAGDIMRMPGLPKNPQAMSIRLENGVIHGLS
jgi:formate--tetrahydrofolate ligase